MQFLLDASLPRDTAKVIAANGHHPADVRDIGLRRAEDSVIAAHARSHKMAIISGDFDFADIRFYTPSDFFGIVIIDRPEKARVADVLVLVERFFLHRDLLDHLVGRLVIVDERRIRIRPPLPEP